MKKEKVNKLCYNNIILKSVVKDMKIVKAEMKDLDLVCEISQGGVRNTLAKYYPKGAVDYFLIHHGPQRVSEHIEKGDVYLYYDDNGYAIATISVSENEIHRLFVREEHQRKGHGSYLLDYFEKKVFESYDKAVLDASLMARNMYEKRGYVQTGFVPYPQDNGDFLCFFPMEKKRP